MSGGLDILALKEEDVLKMLAASTHIGGKNVDWQMSQYIFKRKQDGIHIFDLGKTWEKLLLAARIIAAIENTADVFAVSTRSLGQRSVLKFAAHTGAIAIAGRFTPGTFTNQIQAAFREPRLLIVSDPRADHQPICEASYVNVPVIAFCNSDSPLRLIDVAIPCNTNGAHSVGLMWWMLAREVLRMKGKIARNRPWDIMVDLYFYREPEEQDKEENVKDTVQPPVVTSGRPDEYESGWNDAAPSLAAGALDYGAQDWTEGGRISPPAGAAYKAAPTEQNWAATTADAWAPSSAAGDWASSAAHHHAAPAPSAQPASDWE